MIQALIKRGRVIPEDVPMPIVSPGSVLIKTVYSCISTGTEISGVAQTGKPLIRRALDQPENVRKVLNLIRSEGIVKTYKKILGKLDAAHPTGYSLSGIVIATGIGITNIKPGDRVAAAGAGIANHAEYVDVPINLVMRVPDRLELDLAACVTLGGISMQSIRRADPKIGEFVVVYGTGIMGQLTAQILSASGARVIAVDIDNKRLDLAVKLGAELAVNPNDCDAIKSVHHYTGGHGADIVVFCASTNDNQVLSNAFAMCRKKGRLVMVGVWGQELKREDIYPKELDFLISTAYGPGRYDEKYEMKGVDYPYAYIRWTENRNMEEFLRLLASGRINVSPLIEKVYSINDVEKAFRSLQNPDRPLMVLLDYGQDLPSELDTLVKQPRCLQIRKAPAYPNNKRIRVGLIGAGDFAIGMHLPNFQRLEENFEIKAICSRNGAKLKEVAKKFEAGYVTTDYQDILNDSEIDLIMICTRHNLHGSMVLKSLNAGKHTFVEKPLCTTMKELEQIKSFYNHKSHGKYIDKDLPILMVGFNRRFSKYSRKIMEYIENRTNPLFLNYSMNAGYIPADHWLHSEEGGGRIIGEACHIIDLFSYLVNARVKSYSVVEITPKTDSVSNSDNKCIILDYEDGSIGTINYYSIGSQELPKERLEVHFDEKSIALTDYKTLTGYGFKLPELSSPLPEKGQLEELEELAKHLKGIEGGWIIPLDSLIETTEISLCCA